MEQPDFAPDKQLADGVLGGVPGHMPVHEVVVALALVVGTLAEDRVGDVARMEVGQLRDLCGDPGAAFALLRCGAAGVPHEVVRDELPAPFERFEQ